MGLLGVRFTDYASEIRILDCSRLVINQKNYNDVTIYWHDVIVNFFWRYFFSLIKFSYWSKFHVNIITGSGVMTIYFYKEMTRNLEIGNTLVWVLHNIWKLGRLMDSKFGRNVPKKMLLNAAKCQSSTIAVFESLRENHQGVKLPPLTQIRVKTYPH